MIGRLEGAYKGVSPDGSAIIDVSGVGYAVHVPFSTLAAMQGAPTVTLLIHTAVREDSIDLYGFSTPDEQLFFKQLMSVSGIGPKSALGILNIADVATLKRSIAQGDASALTKVYGIGKKSAERIVVELRDKLADEVGGGELAGAVGTDGEVMEALVALGYRGEEARRALKEVNKKAGSASVQDRIAVALKYLGSNG